MTDYMPKKIYKALDFFMVRTPILPLDKYIELFPSDFNNEQEVEEFSTDLLVTYSKKK